MSRYVVRFRRHAPADRIVASLDASPSVEVIEKTPQMVLVEAASEDTVRRVVDTDSDVVIVPERHYVLPDTRPKVR